MFKDAWGQRQKQAGANLTILRKERKNIDTQIEGLLDRIVEAESPTVISAYEKRIDKLDKKKLILDEKLENHGPSQGTFDHLFEHALNFLANPWKLWESGNLPLQRTVLRLAFAERISYSRSEGLRTPKTTMPFKVLSDIGTVKGKMAETKGVY